MPTPRLSSASEQRILDALEQAQSLMAAGEHPTEALYKVAKALRMPAGHVQLMVNAVNTGQTNSHRLAAEDLFKKADEFPLADAHSILSRLYPDTVKTAAAVERETAVSAEYARGPGEWLNARRLMEKAAAAKTLPPLTDKKYEPYPQDPMYAMRKLASDARAAEQAMFDARRETFGLHDKCVKLAGELVDYFRQPGALPFQDVLYNANELFGTRAKGLLQMAATRLPDGTVKRAGSGMHRVRADRAPYSLIRQTLETGRDYFLKKAEYDAAEKEAEKARKLLSPFGQTPARGRSVLAGLCSTDGHKAAGLLGDLISGGARAYGAHAVTSNVAKKAPGAVPEDADKDYLRKLMDPAHEMTVRNLQAEAMLNNLMANDEVISTHEPQDVLDAYNELSQLAPHASTHTALMRDLIRKRLSGGAGAIDTFTIDGLVGANNKIKQRDEVPAGNLNALQSYGVIPNARPATPKSTSVLD